MTHYATLLEAIIGLKAEGYTEDLNLKQENTEGVNSTDKTFHECYVIDKYFRFDVDSDPSDQSIIYAMSCEKTKSKGILINAYGIYSEPVTDDMLHWVYKTFCLK